MSRTFVNHVFYKSEAAIWYFCGNAIKMIIMYNTMWNAIKM